MTKKELISAVSDDTGISQREVKRVLDSILCNIETEISNGNEVSIKGFGVFEAVGRVVVSNIAEDGKTRSSKIIMPRFRPCRNLKKVTGGTDDR